MALLINGRYLTRPVTGVERYGDMLLRIIAREWPDSRVAVPKGWTGTPATHGLEVIRTGRTSGHLWEQLELPAALRRNEILLSPANSGPWHVRRQVVVVHDLAVIHHPEWFDRRFATWYRLLLPGLIRRAAGIITVSAASERDLQRTYGTEPGRTHVVPPFTIPPARTMTDAGIGSPFYLLVASQDPRKGIDRALHWYSTLQHPPFKLVIAGRPSRVFKPVVHGAVDGVIHLTTVDDDRLDALYRGAIALIQPSRYEGFGLPILEAMARGCPVIASDLPVFREQFGHAIRYAQVGPTPSMQAATLSISDPDGRAALISEGLRQAGTFTPDHTALRLHRVLDPLIAR